jgi:hypothetical protein
VNNIYLINNTNNAIIDELAQLFDLTITKQITIDYPLPYLEFKHNTLWLKYQNMSSLNIDELYQKIINRPNTANELIVRANKDNNVPNNNITVLDITAGLGRDALILQRNNFQVVMFECNLMLVIILNYARIKGYFKPNTTIIHSNSYDYLLTNEIKSISQKCNIYFDPMFKQNKVAKAKKDMQYIEILSQYNNSDHSDEIVFDLCYNLKAINKIIVKRDNKQQPIKTDYKINYSLKSKLIRLDVYLL